MASNLRPQATVERMARHSLAQALGLVGFMLLAACAPIHIASRTIDFGFGPPTSPAQNAVSQGTAPGLMPLPGTPQNQGFASGPSQSFGRGPVQVALLLPLSGDPALAEVGQSMANGSRLAMAFIEANPNIAENTAITLRDTGGTVAGATSATQAAIASGAKLILGPLRGDAVIAAGAMARAAGVPMIGFSNNPQAAGPGVYLLSVLPEMEMKRALSSVKASGRRGVAGVFPNSAYGQAQQAAFRQQASQVGFAPAAVYGFTTGSEAAQIVDQALPLIKRGLIDTFFLPDRTTAPTFATLLAQAGIGADQLQLVGSADWTGDATILGTPALNGALYPAVDPAGMQAIRADYQAQFHSAPQPLTTLAYTATILANVKTLSMATPPYGATLMTNPTGFNGRDGVFRFLGDGRGDYALAMLKVTPGGAVRVAGLVDRFQVPRHELGEFFGREPAHVEGFVVVDAGLAGDVAATEHQGQEVADVPVGIGGGAHSVDRYQPFGGGYDAGFFQHLAQQALGRFLARLQDAGDQSPPAVVSPLAEQHPARVVEHHGPGTGDPQALVADLFAQSQDEVRGGHPASLTRGQQQHRSGSPGEHERAERDVGFQRPAP